MLPVRMRKGIQPMEAKLAFRFEVGKEYRLTKWKADDFDGTVVVRREIRPSDRFENRILVCDFVTDHGTYLGETVYVEPAFVQGNEPLKRAGRQSEFMRLTGVSPFDAKAYALNEVAKEVA